MALAIIVTEFIVTNVIVNRLVVTVAPQKVDFTLAMNART